MRVGAGSTPTFIQKWALGLSLVGQLSQCQQFASFVSGHPKPLLHDTNADVCTGYRPGLCTAHSRSTTHQQPMYGLTSCLSELSRQIKSRHRRNMAQVWGVSRLRPIHLPVLTSVGAVHSGQNGWRTGWCMEVSRLLKGWKSPVNDEAPRKASRTGFPKNTTSPDCCLNASEVRIDSSPSRPKGESLEFRPQETQFAQHFQFQLPPQLPDCQFAHQFYGYS
jgi:hypothetical protein